MKKFCAEIMIKNKTNYATILGESGVKWDTSHMGQTQ